MAILTLQNGLPLGLSAESTYPETNLVIDSEAQLTVLSDGVIEARNTSGELFRFDRAAAIATEPAQKIVQAAKAFGQEDDITVLTLTRAPKPAPFSPSPSVVSV